MKTKQDRRNKVFGLFEALDPVDARFRSYFVFKRARSQKEKDELDTLVQRLYEKALARIEEGIELEYVRSMDQ